MADLKVDGAPELAEMIADLTVQYPAAGEYVIRTRNVGGEAVIALIGRDTAGLEKGIAMWSKFVEYDKADTGPWRLALAK
jgi:hypothetical protein